MIVFYYICFITNGFIILMRREVSTLEMYPCAWGVFVGSEAPADPRILLVENYIQKRATSHRAVANLLNHPFRVL